MPTDPADQGNSLPEKDSLEADIKDLEEMIRQGHKDKLDPKHIEEMAVQLAKALRKLKGLGGNQS